MPPPLATTPADPQPGDPESAHPPDPEVEGPAAVCSGRAPEADPLLALPRDDGDGGAAGRGAGPAAAADDESDVEGAGAGGEEDGEQVSLGWSDVRAWVRDPQSKGGKAEKCVLAGVSGRVDPGEILAVMGPSGAGKTTLLNILAGRPTLGDHGRWEGDVCLDDVPVTRWKRWQRCLGYVMQKDIFFEELSLRDTLEFTSRMRLPYTWSREQKQAKLNEYVDLFGLDGVLNTRIGTGVERGLSGGEVKRTGIVSELLALPRLLLLDEPLTGLDSSRAASVMEMLRCLARKQRRTIMLTIHQPSSNMFELFHRLLLLAPGGRVVFNGNAQDAVAHFSSLGYHMPEMYNPPDFFMEHIADADTADKLTDSYRKLAAESERLVRRASVASWQVALCAKKSPLPPLWYQIMVLSQRGFMQTRRAYLKKIEWVLQFGLAVTFGLLWWQVGRHTESRPDDYVGISFFFIAHWSFYPLFQGLNNFPKQRDVLTKDRASEAYTIEAYFISKVLCEIPVMMVLPFFFFAICYPMVWFPPSYFPQLFGIIALNVQVSAALSMLISVTVFDNEKAIVLAICVMVFTMCAGGYFVNMASLPTWVGELRYASYWYYSLGLFFNYAMAPHGGKDSESLRKYSFSDWSVAGNVLYLIGFIIACRLLSYGILKNSSKTKFS